VTRNVRPAMKPSSAEHGEILASLLSVSFFFLCIYIGQWLTFSALIIVVDFEQPRVLWSTVWDEKAREAYVQNVSGHFKNVKSPEVKKRQCKQFRIFCYRYLYLNYFRSVRVGCCRPRPLGPHCSCNRAPARQTLGSQGCQ
jgi:Catalase-related immune-responsive